MEKNAQVIITQELAKIVGRLHQLRWEVADRPGITQEHTDRIVFLKQMAESDLDYFVKEKINEANSNL